jgi:hypothetical protein
MTNHDQAVPGSFLGNCMGIVSENLLLGYLYLFETIEGDLAEMLIPSKTKGGGYPLRPNF